MQRERLVGQVEQAQQVGHRDAAAPDAQADGLARQAELLDERGAGARLLDGVEVLARHVLDERRLERLGVVALAHERRDRLEAGDLRGAPAALAGDELVRAAGDRPHEHRLQHAALAQRAGERLERGVVERPPRLPGVRRDELDGEHRAGPRARAPRPPETARIAAEAAAHAALRRAHDAAPARTTSLASSKYASEPAQCGSWWVTGRP